MGMSAGWAVLTVVIVLGLLGLTGGFLWFFYKRWKKRQDADGHQQMEEDVTATTNNAQVRIGLVTYPVVSMHFGKQTILI